MKVSDREMLDLNEEFGNRSYHSVASNVLGFETVGAGNDHLLLPNGAATVTSQRENKVRSSKTEDLPIIIAFCDYPNQEHNRVHIGDKRPEIPIFDE